MNETTIRIVWRHMLTASRNFRSECQRWRLRYQSENFLPLWDFFKNAGAILVHLNQAATPESSRSKQTWRHAFRPFFNTQSRLSAIVEWVTRSLLRKKSSREVLVSNLHHFVFFNTNHVDGRALCARKNLSSRMNEIKTRRRNARKKAEISFEVNESSRILFSSLLARHFLLPFTGHQITDELNSTKAIKQSNVTSCRWQLPECKWIE